MPKWPFKEQQEPSDPAGIALHRIEEARKKGAQDLSLFDLKLSTLPEAIGQLTQLRLLDLSRNHLSTLPESVQKLERLDRLFFHGNPGLGLPDEVLGPTAAEVYGSQKRSPKPPREILGYYLQRAG